jgi:hypothetical protein
MVFEGPNSVPTIRMLVADRMKNSVAFELRSVTSSAPHLT